MKTHNRFLLSVLLLSVPALSEEVVIVQKDAHFSHTEVTLKPGDKLVFKNADDFAHNLFSVSPGTQFGSYMEKAGASITVPMVKDGDFEVECAIHPKMKLMVKVRK